MRLKIIRAEDLPASDVNGTSDPFVKISYDGKDLGVTPRVKRNLYPRWDHELAFSLVHGGALYVVLEIWDKDELSANDLLGSLRVPFPEWREHVEEYQRRLQQERQRTHAKQKTMQIRHLQKSQPVLTAGEAPLEVDEYGRAKSSPAAATQEFQRRSRSLNSSSAMHGGAFVDELGRMSSATTASSLLGVAIGAPKAFMDPIKPVLIWSTLVKGAIAQGRLLCSIQFEERDLRMLTNQPYGTNIQDVFLPQNPRFEQVYCHIPRSWHPDFNVRQEELSAIQAGTPKDCLFPWHEKLLHMVEEVTVTFHVNESNQGVLATLVLTNYRVWFVPYRRVRGLVHEDVHTIPIGKILKATISQQKRSNNNITVLVLENMDAGHYHVTLSPISRLRDSVRDSSREAEAKRIKQLQNVVAEIEWLRVENSFCASTDLNHSIVTGDEEQVEDDLRYYTPKHGAISRPPTIRGMSTQTLQASNGLEQKKSYRIYDSEAVDTAQHGDAVDQQKNASARPLLQHHASVSPRTSPPTKNPPLYYHLAGKRRIRYDAELEYRRQGAFEHPRWKHCHLNENYELCSTYPSFLMVPSTLSDDIISKASQFRSKNRLPVLTWIHPRTGAPLCRSSQPNAGVLRSTNTSDKELIWAIRDASISVELGQKTPDALPKKSSLVHIVDARPELNAKSNALAGKGHESVKQYDRDGIPTASIAFMGIDNIHVVRNSFVGLAQALYEVDDANFFGSVQKSRWLEHVCSILQGASEVATHLERGDAVLVHCSDGWDRTAQLSSLAQIMLDPYYRTLEGFAILIEKDWCSFGHMFKKRCGHPTSDQTSPIFQQFLDAVYQLTLQFPTHFQFNELFLSKIAEGVYSSWYGTFQMSSEKERRAFLSKVSCVSVWDVIRASTDQFLNPLFTGGENLRMEPMLPVCRVRLMQLWVSQYQKAISHMRLQQREYEMLLLIRQQETQLSRAHAILTSEQRLELRTIQLRSDISSLARSMNLEYPDEQRDSGVTSRYADMPALNRNHRNRVTASSVDYHDLSSISVSPTSSGENGPMATTIEQPLHTEDFPHLSSPETSTAIAGSNNVPNLRRRKSLTSRTRSNSVKLNSFMRTIIGQKAGTTEAPSEESPATAGARMQTAVQQAVLHHQHLDSLKQDARRLESQLAKLNNQIAIKEENAKQTMRRFRCYNYNLPESAVALDYDDASPSNGGRGRKSGNRSERFHSPSSAFSPSSSSSAGSSPSSKTPKRGNAQGDPSGGVTFTPGSTPLLTNSKVVSGSSNFRVAQPVWERDGDAPCCKRCKKKFKTFYRNRHHCRCCGYVFCGPCTSNRMNLPEFGYYDVVRVCVICYNSGEDG